MKSIYIIIAFVVFFRPVIPVVEYVVNYDYIATVLCENIDKPELECNGKCHLSKELDRSLDKDGRVVFEKYNFVLDYILVSSFQYNLYSHSKVINNLTASKYVNNYNYLACSSLLDPPIL